MNNLLLKKYIRESFFLIKEENQEITWGELKKELEKFANLKKGEKIAKSLAGFVPYLGSARDTFEVIKALMNIPDSKRSSHFLSSFDIDDEIQKIIKNELETEFIKTVVEEIKDKDDNEKIIDFNMTNMLNKFLKKHFNNRGITGYQE